MKTKKNLACHASECRKQSNLHTTHECGLFDEVDLLPWAGGSFKFKAPQLTVRNCTYA